MFRPFEIGFLFALTLMLVFNSSNYYLTKKTLHRHHVALVIAVCAFCDILFFALGSFFMSYLLENHEEIFDLVLFSSSGILFLYGIRYIIRGFKKRKVIINDENEKTGRFSVLSITLGVILFNPIFYINTLIVFGSMSIEFFGLQRLYFFLGACLGVEAWLIAIGFVGRKFSKILANERTWHIVDFFIGFLMFFWSFKTLVYYASINHPF